VFKAGTGAMAGRWTNARGSDMTLRSACSILSSQKTREHSSTNNFRMLQGYLDLSDDPSHDGGRRRAGLAVGRRLAIPRFRPRANKSL
jgi:hypothetical protein